MGRRSRPIRWLARSSSGAWSDIALMRNGSNGILGRLTLPMLFRADRFVVLNEESERELTTLVGRQRVVRIPNGIAMPIASWKREATRDHRRGIGLPPD